MKPKIFVGSSRESLDIAYALQENLEYDAEITVWNQGIFDLSRYTLDELTTSLDVFDYGVFIFAPDDVLRIRNREMHAVRDNVIFEFGLFVGRLGRDRTFIILPRGEEGLRLPTDLLGITPGVYEPQRADGNLVASLGSACNKIRRVIRTMGLAHRQPFISPSEGGGEGLIRDDNDAISLLEAWLGSRPLMQNRQVIKYRDVDRELGLKNGAAKQHIGVAAARWGYRVSRKGEETILFE